MRRWTQRRRRLLRLRGAGGIQQCLLHQLLLRRLIPLQQRALQQQRLIQLLQQGLRFQQWRRRDLHADSGGCQLRVGGRRSRYGGMSTLGAGADASAVPVARWAASAGELLRSSCSCAYHSGGACRCCESRACAWITSGRPVPRLIDHALPVAGVYKGSFNITARAAQLHILAAHFLPVRGL